MKKKMNCYKIIVIFLFFSLFFCIYFLSACSNSTQTMLDEYNSHFVYTTTEVPEPVPGDSDFNAEDMLDPYYYVRTDATLNLSAPKSSSYYWSLSLKGEDKTTCIRYLNSDFSNQTRRFIFYLPDSKPTLDVGTYIVTLLVTDSEGNEYQDSAKLVVFEED